MKVLLVDNAHIYQTPDGKYYSPTIYGDKFFERYLRVFEKVKFVAKVKHIKQEEADNLLPITLANVEISPIPWYRGSRELVRKIVPVIRSYFKVCSDCDCSILRIAQLESFLAYIFSGCRKKPLAVEMVNDPLEFRDMNGIMRWFTVYMTRKILNRANGASYVTKDFLQSKYPCRKVVEGKGFSNYYSSISLLESDISDSHTKIGDKIKLIHVSNSITSNIKGHKEVIDVVAALNRRDIDCNVIFVGDGSAIHEFQEYARKKEVYEKIHFIGRVASHEEIMALYRDSDIFIFPTKLGEGLPRVVIEAMASGLPCVVAPAGGVAELIDSAFIIPADNTDQYVARIEELFNDKHLYESQSVINIERAKRYTEDVLNKRRAAYYLELRKLVDKT